MATHRTIVALIAGLIVVPALAQDSAPPQAQPQTGSLLHATGAYPVRQARTQWLGSNLIGAKVVSAANEPIGRIANLLVNDDGAIESAMVAVGGVFGMGARQVAVTYKSLNIMRNQANDGIDRIVLAATKNDLRQAAAFITLKDQNQERTPRPAEDAPVMPARLTTPLP